MPKIKLTDADVRGLRYARNVEGASLAFLANAYGVSKAQVSRVTRGLQRRTPEVSSHEETPEVGKWVRDEWEGSDVVSYTTSEKINWPVGYTCIDVGPDGKPVFKHRYDDPRLMGPDQKAKIRERWLEIYEELKKEVEAGERGKNLQEF